MNFKKILIPALCAANAVFAATVYQNQVGFVTNGLKQLVVIDGAGKTVSLKDSGGKVVFSSTVPEAQSWVPAGTDGSLVDFSELKTAGTYKIFIGDEEVGHPVVISNNALEAVAKGALKFFYFQRASTALDEKYAGKYARDAGHPDTSVKYHASTGHDASLGETFKAPKGWYDAGDYGKYIVNSGISTYTLLQLYQQNKAYFDTLNLNIPESGNKIPDILDEIRWNLDWMLAMQDEDGGVFHKLTTLKFAGMVMPSQTNAQRYAIGKGIEATWNFAAVMALAADIYSAFDSKFASACAKAADKAHQWAIPHAAEKYTQPKDVSTGSYTGASLWPLRIWANAELYRISQNKNYMEDMHYLPINSSKVSLQSWSNSSMLWAFTTATSPKAFEKADVDTAKAMIFRFADEYVKSLENNGFGVPMVRSDFYWGSNGGAANKGMILIHAYILSKDEKYLNAAIGIADYILGRNPLDLSYLTGYGVNQVMNPHHRPSQADEIEEPVPGMVAGGPNASATDCAKSYVNTDAVAKSYYDNSCSYSTNEVAINWNAPFAYLVGSIQAILATGKVYDSSNGKSSASYELTSIPSSKAKFSPVKAGSRLIVKDNSVLLERTAPDGTKRFFNLRGKKLH